MWPGLRTLLVAPTRLLLLSNQCSSFPASIIILQGMYYFSQYCICRYFTGTGGNTLISTTTLPTSSWDHFFSLLEFHCLLSLLVSDPIHACPQRALSARPVWHLLSFASELSPPLFLIQVPFWVLSSGIYAHIQYLQFPANLEETTARLPGASSGKDLCTSVEPFSALVPSAFDPVGHADFLKEFL